MNKQFPNQSGAPQPMMQHSGSGMGPGNSSDDNRIKIILVIVAGVIFAPILGTMLAQGEFFQLTVMLASLLGVIYVALLSGSWPLWAWLYASIGFMLRPAGFAMGALEVCSLLAGLYIVATIWQKPQTIRSQGRIAFKPFGVAFIIFTLYLGLHALYNHAYPFNNETLSIQNSAKTYFAMWAGFFLAWVGTQKPELVRLPKNIFLWFGLILVFGVTLNTILRLYGIVVLHVDAPSELSPSLSSSTAIFIPVLNATENVFVLRSLGPISVLFAMTVLTSSVASAASFRVKVISWYLLLMGIAACLLSAGRATLLTGIILAAGVLLLRGRVAAVIAVPIVAIPLIFATKMTYDYDSRLVPASVQRALAILPFMDMKEAAGSIEGSSNWRNELFTLSINDWLQEPRTITTGRGGYAWTDADTFAMDQDTYTGLMISALRRGATHNLFTDLVVTIGIIGFLLYCITYATLLWGVSRIRKLVDRTSDVYDWSLMAQLYLPVTFLIALLGGGFFTDFSGLFIAICIFLCSHRNVQKPRFLQS